MPYFRPTSRRTGTLSHSSLTCSLHVASAVSTTDFSTRSLPPPSSNARFSVAPVYISEILLVSTPSCRRLACSVSIMLSRSDLAHPCPSGRLLRWARRRRSKLALAAFLVYHAQHKGQWASVGPPAVPEFRLGVFSEDASGRDLLSREALYKHALSGHRPLGQFACLGRSRSTTPSFLLASVISSSSDATLVRQSLEALRSQSWHDWVWVIICIDCAASTPAFLHDLTTLDDRVRLHSMHCIEASGSCHNAALRLMTQSGAAFAAFLPPYAVLELTILEKAIWTLMTVREWDLLGYQRTGDLPSSTYCGLHLGKLNPGEAGRAANRIDPHCTDPNVQNCVFESTIFRTAALGSCTFAEAPSLRTSFLSFWLCFALKGKWGGDLPEPGIWFGSTFCSGVAHAELRRSFTGYTLAQVQKPSRRTTGGRLTSGRSLRPPGPRSRINSQIRSRRLLRSPNPWDLSPRIGNR